MLRPQPPSLQHEYTLVFSGDPALSLPSDEKERENALRVARETGRWDELTIDGQQPTLFQVRPLSQSAFRWLGGEINRKNLSPGEAMILAVRLALRKIDNFDGHKVALQKVDEQQLVTMATIDALFGVDPNDLDVGRNLVDELGAEIIRRASEGISPKR